MSSTYLGNLAQALLDSAAAALVQASTGRAAPSVTVLSHGPPPLEWCCNDGMLAVHLASVTHGPSDVPHVPCGVDPVARFVVTVARCWPAMDDSGLLDADEFDTAAADHLEDLWCLLTEFYDRLAAGTLFPGQVTCEQVEIGDAEPLDAEGGCAGWTIEVTVHLNDSGPVGS